MAYILRCPLVLKFEKLIVHCRKMCHFSWDSTYPLQHEIFIIICPLVGPQTATNKVRIRITLNRKFCPIFRTVYWAQIGPRSCFKNIKYWNKDDDDDDDDTSVLWELTLCSVLHQSWHFSTDVPQITTLHPRCDHCTENLKSHTRARHLSQSKHCIFMLSH
jgi:hypothetical protein